MGRPLINVTGMRFGRLVVAGRSGTTKHGQATWLCVCDCGVEKELVSWDLRSGAVQSCGCLNREQAAEKGRLYGGRKPLQHGHSRKGGTTRLYWVWSAMIQRCYNLKNKSFENYGGRGIKVCPRWRDSFENFLTDMGPTYMAGLSIDRYPDNDGNYEPDNCRWATRKQQNNNTRRAKQCK